MYKYYKKNIKWKRECEHSVETSEFFCPFSFYVKSILEILGVIKGAINAVLEAVNFIFGKFRLSKYCKIGQNENSDSLKSISRKICQDP